MTTRETARRLTAILVADVAGFSRLMAQDEARTLAALRRLRSEVLEPSLRAHGGRLIKTMGDGFLAEFPSAVGAVSCALAIQGATDDGEIRLRIGINVGDVVVEGEDILGDGVNVAARIEPLAPVGGIAISGVAHDAITGKVAAEFRPAGTKALKNIDRDVQVWLWRPDGTQDSDAAPARALARPDPRPSIVVLPFDTLSADPVQDYVAVGFVEAITAVLSRIRSFFVIARNTAYAFRGRQISVPEIGRELGVAYALEGSVQIAGQRIRVTVQLIETESGNHIWADRYDGQIEDMFDLQDRITEKVAGALQPSIRMAEIEKARRKRPQDLGAYDFSMRALRHVWTLEHEESEIAMALLEQALALDPDYPFALALAAWCHAQRSVYNWTDDPRAALDKALALAQRAEAQGEDDPLTLAVLGTVLTLALQPERARGFLERAVAIDPNSAWAWARLGWLEAYAGNAEKAETHLRRSLELSPLDPLNFNTYGALGAARAQIGDYKGALPHFERALSERPGAIWLWRILCVCLMGAGEEARAREAARHLMEVQPNFTIRRYLEAVAGRKEMKAEFADLLRRLGLPEG
ncbi:MAG: tetratricopeptide repeat protein [Rhodobacteraceae bacterium]|nr:MAG: tetratricopeptide repeat protein [Paracoccaceae bacterium]